jgi:hypothetical protein
MQEISPNLNHASIREVCMRLFCSSSTRPALMIATLLALLLMGTVVPGVTAASRREASPMTAHRQLTAEGVDRRPPTRALPCDQGPRNAPRVAQLDLDQNIDDWGVFCEGRPDWAKSNVATPSLNSPSLRCGILGGDPYSNVHCYRNLPAETFTTHFTLTLSFWFSPTTTFNDQGGSSVVQALEFSISKWRNSQRHEFALEWRNIGTGAPQWRYWDAHATPDRWVDLSIADQPALLLAGNTWHSLELSGEIVNGQAHYRRFAIDSHVYVLNQVAAPAIEPGTRDHLAIAVQADGNAAETPYDLFIDRVNFTSTPYVRVLPLVLR